VHVLRERVQYVHWSPDETGGWLPQLIVRDEDGSLELITRSSHQRLSFAHDYDWSHAFSWNQRIVAPTSTGVGILQLQPILSEQYQNLLPPQSKIKTQKSKIPRPVTLLDTRGLLAFIPPTPAHPGSPGAWRFVEDRWVPLGPEQGWPGQILHLVPLLDGSVLQIIPDKPGTVRLALAPLESTEIDQEVVEKLIEHLSDPDPLVRNDASQKLSLYGPGVYPLLEQRLPHQPPEGRKRLRQLLANKLKPTLGGMSLIDSRLRCIARFPGGGAVFYAEGGVALANPEGNADTYLTPAWLAILPGQPIALLPQSMIHDLPPDKVQLQYIPTAPPEWIVSSAATGPQRYIGNRLVALLHPDERQFTHLLAIDAKGRWLFCPAQASASPTTDVSPLSTERAARSTLILDPTLASLTPRLPGWVMAMGRSAGWDNHDWPVTTDAGGNQWALHESGWQVLDKKTNRMHANPKEVPAVHWRPRLSATHPTTRATTIPATSLADKGHDGATAGEPAEAPLLVLGDGSAYFGGNEALRLLSPDGRERTYPLPPDAVGQLDRPILLRTHDGLLFLYNAPGRLLRLKLTPHATPPLSLQATFTHNIPNTDTPTRLWLDPAGRICFLDGQRLTLLFPQGRIPPAIRTLMPAEALQAAEEP
jgi:hypothetical protein